MRIYERGENRYLSVTSILDMMFPFNEQQFRQAMLWKGIDPDYVTSESRRVGNYVHNWIDNAVNYLDVFDTVAYDESLKGYRLAVDNYLEQYKTKYINTEFAVLCEDYGYAGRCDGLLKIDGQFWLVDYKTYGAWKKTKDVDIDLKETGREKKVQYQLSMYNYALSKGEYKQALIWFFPNGKYEFTEYPYTEQPLQWISGHQDKIGIEKAKARELEGVPI